MSWAKAADWPVLAAGNPEGFEHPISVIIYRVNGDVSLTLLAKKTQQVRESVYPRESFQVELALQIRKRSLVQSSPGTQMADER